MKTVILTENQVKNVIDRIINEQNSAKTETLAVDLGAAWSAGKWKMTSQQISSIDEKLRQITDFITKHKDSSVTIQIESGESQVTNYDREVSGNVKLEPGVLSQNRGNQLVTYLTNFFQKLVSNGVITKIPEFPKPISKIGMTPYTGPNDLKDPSKKQKYDQEQYVKAIISLKKDYECIVGMEITIGYYPGKSKSSHTCDEAIFELRMNGVSLGEANLNNGPLDTTIEKIREINKKRQDHYDKTADTVAKNWEKLVASGSEKDTPNRKRKYFKDNLSDGPIPAELPNTFDAFSRKRGYTNVNDFVQEVDKINNAFKKYGRNTSGTLSGMRAQTFILDGAKAKAIIDNAPSDKIVLSIVPLVSKDGKYKIFFDKGSHADTPWVTIKNPKAPKPLYDGEPNISMARGSTKETVLLSTDLCGNPITLKK